jgi:hypothetical protein
MRSGATCRRRREMKRSLTGIESRRPDQYHHLVKPFFTSRSQFSLDYQLLMQGV